MHATPQIRMKVALALAALVGASPLGALAAPVHAGGGRAGEGLALHLLQDPEIREAAEITGDQVTEIEQTADEFRREAIERRAQIDLARLDLQQAWRGEEPDAEAIHAAIDRLTELEAAQRHAQADLRLRTRAVLSTEQREAIHGAVRERMEKRAAERRERRGAVGQRIQDSVRARVGEGFRQHRPGPALGFPGPRGELAPPGAGPGPGPLGAQLGPPLFEDEATTLTEVPGRGVETDPLFADAGWGDPFAPAEPR